MDSHEEKSAVWLHFRHLTNQEKVVRDQNSPVRFEPAVCLHCHEQVPRNDSSTKYMWSHLTDPQAKGGHGLARNVLENLRAAPKPPPISAFFEKKTPKTVKSQVQDALSEADFHRLCLRAVIGGNLPFTFFENAHVLALLSAIAPTRPFPSAKVLKRLRRTKAEEVRAGTSRLFNHASI